MLSGWLDLKGLQAVMYRAGTHTSSAEDLNAGEHKARPSVKNEWLHVETTLNYLMQAPHPTDMYQYILSGLWLSPQTVTGVRF